MSCARLLGLLVPLVPASGPLPLLWSRDLGPDVGDRVELVGDQDGDGLRDLAVGRAMGSRRTVVPGPAVRVFSSRDGSALFELDLAHAHPLAGWTVRGIGDLDGDGVPDLAALAEPPDPEREQPEFEPQMLWISGRTSLPIAGRPGWDAGKHPAQIAPVASASVRGLDEPVLCVSGGDGGGVDRLNFADGVLASARTRGARPPTDFTQALRIRLAEAGSTTRIGLAFAVSGCVGEASSVELFELRFDEETDARCARLWQSAALDDEAFCAFAVLASPGDLDGDGRDDLLAGVDVSDWVLGRGIPGRVRALSGSDGHALYELCGEIPEGCFGSAMAPLGDVDADGRPDFAVGEYGGYGSSGRVTLVSGRDGARLSLVEGGAGRTFFGAWLGSPGDVDGDGVDDWIVLARIERDRNDVPATWTALCLSTGHLLRSTSAR